MEAVASSLYLTERDRRGKTQMEKQKRKTTEGKNGRSTRVNRDALIKKRVFKATQYGNLFKGAVSQSCMELYLGLIYNLRPTQRGLFTHNVHKEEANQANVV